MFTEDSTIEFAPIPTDPRFMDLTHQPFGRLIVLGYAGKRGVSHRWHCECSCGSRIVAQGGNLRKGHTTSCGCFRTETAGNATRTHGESKGKSLEYNSYLSARGRCNNPNNAEYPNYGQRGIEFRFTSYEQFLACVGRRPSAKHSLNRIDNDGHYDPGNVEWATQKQQMRNMRRNLIVTLDDREYCLAELQGVSGIKLPTIQYRVNAGWCGHCAVYAPLRMGCAHH